MSVFDLDEQGRRTLDEQVSLNPLDLSKVTPSFFHGFGTALGGGTMRGGARTGEALAIAGAAPIMAAQELGSERGQIARPLIQSLPFGPAVDSTLRLASAAGDNLLDSYFDNTAAPAQQAVEFWTPDPAQVGTAGRVLGGLSEILLPLAAGGGNPALLAATEGLQTPASMVEQGVDPGTATALGTVSAAATALGFKVPAAFGSNLFQRVASGAAANTVVGTASQAAQSAVLEAGGYDEQAKQFSPWNAEARTVDLLTGAVFGGIAHAQARPVSVVDRDATLTAANAKHVQLDTAPGIPADQVSSAAHQRAISEAIGSLLRGEQVSVADLIDPAEFIPRQRQGIDPGAMELTGEAPAGYTAYRRALESGFRADAANPASSALGIDQFTAPTWRRIVAQTKPAWAQGLTDAQLLAARRDPVRSGEMVEALDAQSAATLAQEGLPASAHNLYAMHHFGPASGKRFARAAEDAPVSDLITPEQLAANPYLRGMTKGEALAHWDARAHRAGVLPDGGLVDTNEAGQTLRRRLVDEPDALIDAYAQLEDSAGGTVLNTDVARELSPEYLADRTRSADVHEAASDFVKTLYERKLAAPTPEGFERKVMFTAGGTGAGKTTAVAAVSEALGRPEIVYDTNMNTLRSAEQKVQQALDAGRDVTIAYVYRDPVEALTGGAIPRAQRQAERFGTGRTVPLEEHARTHEGVRGVMDALAKRYADDSRVTIIPIDNSRGKGRQAILRSLADVPRQEQNQLRERLRAALEEARAAGLPEDLYRGFASQGRDARAVVPANGAADGGSPAQGDRGQVAAPGKAPTPASPEAQIAAITDQAAAEAALAFPDLQVVLDDGSIVSAAEALAQADADIVRAQSDSRGFAAAVACSLRFA